MSHISHIYPEVWKLLNYVSVFNVYKTKAVFLSTFLPRPVINYLQNQSRISEYFSPKTCKKLPRIKLGKKGLFLDSESV